VPTLEDAAALAFTLPEVTEGLRRGSRTWLVAGKAFAWERPLSKADIKRLGDEPAPAGEILAVRVEDLHEKEAVLAQGHRGFFTIAHFDGYPALLIQLETVGKRALKDAILDAWLAMAPDKLAQDHLRSVGRPRSV
jgi:hypothetical protein